MKRLLSGGVVVEEGISVISSSEVQSELHGMESLISVTEECSLEDKGLAENADDVSDSGYADGLMVFWSI